MFKRKRSQQAGAQVDAQALLGPELAARLVNILGPDKLAQLANDVVADAKARWARRFEKDVVSEEEMAAIGRMASEAGANTIETRAAFQTIMIGKKIAAQAALAALQRAEVPTPDQLILDLGERVYSVLD